MDGGGDEIERTILIDDLQIQLTKLQIQCLEERRNFLGLVGKNEQLELENEDLRRKFQASLLLGKVDEKGVTHFLQNNPKAPQLTDKIIKINEDLKKCSGEKLSKIYLQNPIVLTKQVAFLEKHMDDLKQQNLVEIFGLKTSLELAVEERELMKGQYESRLKELVKKLEDARNLTHKTTEESLLLKKKMILFEEEKTIEQQKLIKQLAEASGGFVTHTDGLSDIQQIRQKPVPPLHTHLLEKLTRSEILVLEMQNILKEYEMKFIQVERKLNRAKKQESMTKQTCADVIRKLKAKNESIEARFDKLDQRRKMDNAGFREDIKAIKQLITTLERKIHIFMHRRINEVQQCESDENTNPNVAQKVEKDLKETATNTNTKQSHSVLRPRNSGSGSLKSNVVKTSKNCSNKLPKPDPDQNDVKDVQQERQETRDELEKDKLIYQMLCKILESAKLQATHVEKGILKNR